jgi:hypothetical protein
LGGKEGPYATILAICWQEFAQALQALAQSFSPIWAHISSQCWQIMAQSWQVLVCNGELRSMK